MVGLFLSMLCGPPIFLINVSVKSINVFSCLPPLADPKIGLRGNWSACAELVEKTHQNDSKTKPFSTSSQWNSTDFLRVHSGAVNLFGRG